MSAPKLLKRVAATTLVVAALVTTALAQGIIAI